MPANSPTQPSPAYVMGHIVVQNVEKWAAYRAQVPATLAPWQAELLLRGQAGETLGEAPSAFPYADVVVIRFRSMADAQAWFASPAYQALLPLRAEAAQVVLRVYEGS